MKIDDISTGFLAEAPNNMLKRAGNKLAQMNPLSPGKRAQARGASKSGATARKLWTYYQEQLGQSGKTPNTVNLTKFFTQKPYNVKKSVIKAAFQSAGIYAGSKTAKVEDDQVDAVFQFVVQNAPQAFNAGDNATIPSDVIDVVKSLKPAQKQALGKTLLGKQTNV